MEKSPLSKLPPEMRTIIYEQVLCDPHDLVLAYRPTKDEVFVPSLQQWKKSLEDKVKRSRPGSGTYKPACKELARVTAQLQLQPQPQPARSPGVQVRQHRNMLSLLAVCKQIRQESLTVFYSKNTFRFITQVERSGFAQLGGLANIISLHQWYRKIHECYRLKLVSLHISIESVDWSGPSEMTNFCRDMASIAGMLSGARTSCNWDIKLDYDDRTEYVKTEYSAEGKRIWLAWKNGTVSREGFGNAQGELQTRRRYVEPMLKRLAKELELVEKASKRSEEEAYE